MIIFSYFSDSDLQEQKDDIDKLRQRYTQLQEDVDYCQEVMKYLNERNLFNVELILIEKVLDGYKKWMESAVKPTDQNKYLEQCRNMMHSLKENETKVLHLQDKSRDILSQNFPAIDVSKIQSDAIRLNELWQTTVTTMTKKEAELTKALDTTPPSRYSEEVGYLKTKIDSLESVLMIEHAIISDKKTMETKLKNLRDIEDGLTEAEEAYSYVKQVGNDMYNRTGLDAQGERLKFELDDLNTRWTDVKIILAEKISKLSNGMILLYIYTYVYVIKFDIFFCLYDLQPLYNKLFFSRHCNAR